jgi:SH3-like domain-containing protein
MTFDALTIPHMAHGQARVRDAKLNVRAEPQPAAPILGQLAPGELVTVWALDDGWAIVQNVSGLTGWSKAEHMTLEDLTP